MSLRRKAAQNHADIATLQAEIASIAADAASNVKYDYGASGNGSSDDYAAIQEALNAVPSTGGAIYIPRGFFRNNSRPWRIKTPYTRVFGEGYGSLLRTAIDGPAFLCVGTQPSLAPTVVSPLNPDGVGKAIHFTGSNDRWIVPSRNKAFGSLNGLTQFGLQLRYKPDAIDNSYNIVSSCGNLSTSNGISAGTLGGAFQLYADSGVMRCKLNIGGVQKAVGDATQMVVGTTYHWRVCWDGTNLKLFKNGTVVQTTAAAGALTQKLWEDVVLGPSFAGWQQSNLQGPDAKGYVDQLQIVSSTANWGMSNFTPPTSHTVDGYTLALVDFSGDADSDYAIFAIKNKNGTSWNEFYQASAQAYGCQGIQIEDLRFQSDNQAIEGWICSDSRFRNLRMENCQGHALHLRNNSYNTTLQNIYATGGGIQNNALICVQEASGASRYDNIKTQGGKVGVLLDNAGGTFTHSYCVGGSIADAWLKDTMIEAVGLELTDENAAAGQQAALIFDAGTQGFRGDFNGGNFEVLDSTCPTIILDSSTGTHPRISIGGSLRLANTHYATSHIKTYGSLDLGSVCLGNILNAEDGATPLIDDATLASGLNGGALSVRSLSLGVVQIVGPVSYSIGATDGVVVGDASAGDINPARLPAVASSAGRVITIKCAATGGNSFFIAAQVGETLEDFSTHAQVNTTAIAVNNWATYFCDGSAWYLIGKG